MAQGLVVLGLVLIVVAAALVSLPLAAFVAGVLCVYIGAQGLEPQK